jgi:hypothetical protein
VIALGVIKIIMYILLVVFWSVFKLVYIVINDAIRVNLPIN